MWEPIWSVRYSATSAATVVYVNGYIRAVRLGGNEKWLSPGRVVGAGACYLIELVGTALLIGGVLAGLYIAAVMMILLLAFMISGAWLLIIGVSTHQRSR